MCDGAALRDQSHRMMVRVEPGAVSRQAGWHRRICISCPSRVCRDGIFVLLGEMMQHVYFRQTMAAMVTLQDKTI